MSEVPDFRSELEAYRQNRGEGDVSPREAEELEEREELEMWKRLDETCRHAKRTRERYQSVSSGLIAAALGSSDPVVRGLAWRLEELHMQLRDLT